MSSRYDIVIVLVDILQLWLLAQDWSHQHSIMIEGGPMSPLPLLDELSAIHSCRGRVMAAKLSLLH